MNNQINKTKEEEELDEGLKDFISLSIIASLLSFGNILTASEIESNIPNKATFEQIQNGLNKSSEISFGDYSAAQATNILVRTLYCEGMSETREGREYIATVIWNRAGGKSENFPKVCLAKSQFSCWRSLVNRQADKFAITIPKSVLTNKKSAKIWDECREIAEQLIDGTFTSKGDYNAYLNPKKASKLALDTWATKMTNVIEIGNHKFGYLPEHDGFKRSEKQSKKSKSSTPAYLSTYTVTKADKGVSIIAKKLIKNKQTPYTSINKLTNEIIKLNNLGPKAIIKVGKVLKLPTN